MNVLRHLDRQSRAALVVLGLVLVALAGLLHYLTAPDLSFLIYYLVPVALVAWFAGKWAGILIAVAGAAASALVWLTAGPGARPTGSYPGISYGTVTAQFAFFLVILVYMLAALKAALERAEQLARTDYLTGVANARHFAEVANAELGRVRRYPRPFSLCYIDIDDFKAVNDRFGHGTGDTVLRIAAETMRSRIRMSDVIARVGGDEFAILLPEADYDAAEVVMRKVHESLSDAMRQRGWPVTFSMGMVTCLEPPDSADELIRAADSLMYSGKYGGKNTVRHEVVGKPPAT